MTPLNKALDFTSMMDKPLNNNAFPGDDRPKDFDVEGQTSPVYGRVVNGLHTRHRPEKTLAIFEYGCEFESTSEIQVKRDP